MTIHYYKTFKVPNWVLLDTDVESNITKTIIGWFSERGALNMEWPSRGFKEKLLSYKNKGWAHILNNTDTLLIPPQLLATAANEHLKDFFKSPSIIDQTLPIHLIDRKIRSELDYNFIFNDLLNMQDTVILSKIFQVGEICHDDAKKNKPQWWITGGDYDRNCINKLSDNVLTVGEGAGYDIDVSGVSKSKVNVFLEEQISELIKKNRIKKF